MKRISDAFVFSCAMSVAVAGFLAQRGHTATHMLPETIEQRAAGSQHVWLGKVRETRTERHKNSQGDELIMTRVYLDVTENLKGEPHPGNAQILIEGGSLDGLTLQVSDMPTVVVNEDLVVFLETDSLGEMKPHRRGHGILRLEKGTGKVRNSSLTLAQIRDKTRGTN